MNERIRKPETYAPSPLADVPGQPHTEAQDARGQRPAPNSWTRRSGSAASVRKCGLPVVLALVAACGKDSVILAPVVPQPSFTLTGTVRDSRETQGFVLPGATVRLAGGESTLSDADGRYRFHNVSGAITVTATAPYYVPQTVEVTVDADRALDFDLEHLPTAEGASRGVWTSPDILDNSDPTSLRSVLYAGRGVREFWDTRAQTWVRISVYLFNVRYSGREVEFQVHPELGSREAARAVVDTYAPIVGRVPAVLLSGLEQIELSLGTGGLGANRGKGIIHIPTSGGDEHIDDGFIEEVLIHEAAHVSLDPTHRDSPGWRMAQQADEVFINEYARDYPDREDIAESFLAYFIVAYRPERVDESTLNAFRNAIPNRLAYFEELGLDMSPYPKCRWQP